MITQNDVFQKTDLLPVHLVLRLSFSVPLSSFQGRTLVRHETLPTRLILLTLINDKNK